MPAFLPDGRELPMLFPADPPSGYPADTYLLVRFPTNWIAGDRCLEMLGQFDSLPEAQAEQRKVGGVILSGVAWRIA